MDAEWATVFTLNDALKCFFEHHESVCDENAWLLVFDM